eukprot:2861620-Rhodomonas_salina.3
MMSKSMKEQRIRPAVVQSTCTDVMAKSSPLERTKRRNSSRPRGTALVSHTEHDSGPLHARASKLSRSMLALSAVVNSVDNVRSPYAGRFNGVMKWL